ncbi:helix-turn-helix domain-containing protein [Jannaschia pohangensis]|uniref:Helix-turn-helix n=1 Tax=Jannaschia pohangensis TaxID=390807 RepID=A0A1I3IG19_9RHOB|nr:helix-turn-helix transcriptional regulator [Jannaschia pohangensis]SFI46767.1 Helix-turn-helix [Jannaschia pohangensis]
MTHEEETTDPADWFDPDATTFGDRLTGAREAAGLDAQALAQSLGVKPKTIEAWEEDRSEPRAHHIVRLAGLTNVTLVWLMTGQGDGPSAEGVSLSLGEELVEVEALRRDSMRMTERLRRLEARLRMQAVDA